jgi:hypothetical protein
MAPGPISTRPVDDTVRELRDLLHGRSASFAVGVRGAVAEFHWAPGDRAEHICGNLGVATARGGIRITPSGEERHALLPLGDDRRHGHDSHDAEPRPEAPAVYWLPREAARLHGGHGLCERGPDHAALRPDDADGVIFDLGLALGHVLACVRTADPDLLAVLRAHRGVDVLTRDNPVVAAIKQHSPHRVFISRMARIEVYQRIPSRTRGEGTPTGPHTHLLPTLLGRVDASLDALPVDACPLLTVYPASA